MTQPENTPGPTQQEVDKARESLARPQDDEDGAAATTRDASTEPDTSDPES
jgi:hypothetical protein